ncbi:MAG TPA: hypothetical protein VFN78_01280, partial [Ktedonobacterales bacterium]|nr:hypothetical protein [Ktedonobacterales bacterium]
EIEAAPVAEEEAEAPAAEEAAAAPVAEEAEAAPAAEEAEATPVAEEAEAAPVAEEDDTLAAIASVSDGEVPTAEEAAQVIQYDSSAAEADAPELITAVVEQNHSADGE